MSDEAVPHLHAESLETDSQETSSDVDSALGDEVSSIRSQSVTSSIYQHRFENGRRYHAYRDGTYYLPNDDEEQDRLVSDRTHNVLDVGCGTGIWAIDFADAHPNARVLGVDLSPIQPLEVPPNCSFLVDDVEADWLYDHKFDLIHSRAMVGGFKSWPRFFKQAYDNLNPGGYLELHEYCLPASCSDPALTGSSKTVAWTNHVIEAGNKIRLNMRAPLYFESMLREAGFVDVATHWEHWPIGPWARGDKNKQLGRWLLANLYEGVATTSAMFSRVLGWSNEEFQVFQAEVRNEMKKMDPRVYKTLCFCYARKPEVEDNGVAS